MYFAVIVTKSDRFLCQQPTAEDAAAMIAYMIERHAKAGIKSVAVWRNHPSTDAGEPMLHQTITAK